MFLSDKSLMYAYFYIFRTLRLTNIVSGECLRTFDGADADIVTVTVSRYQLHFPLTAVGIILSEGTLYSPMLEDFKC